MDQYSQHAANMNANNINNNQQQQQQQVNSMSFPQLSAMPTHMQSMQFAFLTTAPPPPAAAAAGGGITNHQYIVDPQASLVLQGKPLSGMHHSPHSASSIPLVNLPGGTYIQPHMSLQMNGGGAMMASGSSGGGGYPQLVGLPAGYSMAPPGGSSGMLPTLVATQPAGMHHFQLPGFGGAPLAVAVKQEPQHHHHQQQQHQHGEDRPSSSHSANTSAGGLGSDGSPHVGGSGGTPGSAGGNKSRYRGVSYDRKKAKWRVQIKVAALGKSGVSVGYFDTEEAAARAYDRAAIGLLGRDSPNLQTNFDLADYANEPIPRLTGKSREEVKTTLKSERIKQAPRRRFTSRQRTSRFMGVGSSNRKNQWQARILVHGKVTHLGYYETEEDAARVYDRVSLALHGEQAQTNFPVSEYTEQEVVPYRGLDREDLQRALGVKPMDKSSRFRGVSKKKGKWEAKVMVNRRWAYRELFDSEEEAARAYDRALWRLKPREARSYVNFKDEIPADAEALAAAAAVGGVGGGGGPGNYHRGALSDGDLLDTDGGGGNGGGGGDDDDFSDGGDFEYEYRPTKGTTRSVSMRAKRAGSMPNLASSLAAGAAAASAAAAANNNNNNSNRGGSSGQGDQYQQQQYHQQNQQQQQQQSAAASVVSDTGPSFVALPGGGLQLHFNPGSGTSMFHNSSHIIEEPLLIRVGSETHVLPSSYQAAAAGSQILGKRTGLQRIHSEPQLPISTRNFSGQTAHEMMQQQKHHHGHNSHHVPGANLSDIHDLMNDKDLFDGLDLAEMAGTPGIGAGPIGSSSVAGLDLHSFEMDFMTANVGGSGGGGGGGGGGDDGLSGLLFEDEELALANLEFSRPRKIPKSMSMSQLSALAGAGDEEAPLLLPSFTTGHSGPTPSHHHHSGVSGHSGRPPCTFIFSIN